MTSIGDLARRLVRSDPRPPEPDLDAVTRSPYALEELEDGLSKADRKQLHRPFLGEVGGWDAYFHQNAMQVRAAKVWRLRPMRHADDILNPARARVNKEFVAKDGVRTSVVQLFPERADEVATERERIANMLEEFRVEASPPPGSHVLESTTLLPKLRAAGLTSTDYARLIDCITEYRLSLERNRPFDPASTDANWHHILTEMGYAVDGLRRDNITGERAADVLYASLFSDCAKFDANLLTPNIHGAAAAAHILDRRGDMPRERIARIVAATEEHHVGPPSFWAMMIGFGLGLHKTGKDDPRRHLIEGIQRKIAEPYNPEHVEVGRSGAAQIRFTDEELEALKEIGIEKWAVPHPDNQWFNTAIQVIFADTVANYANPSGISKMIKLSGPGKPGLEDPLVFFSMFSPGTSLNECLPLLPPHLRNLVEHRAERTKAILMSTSQELRTLLDAHQPLPVPLAELGDQGQAETDADRARAKIAALADLEPSQVNSSQGIEGDAILIDLPVQASRDETPYVGKRLNYQATGPDADNEIATAKLVRHWFAHRLQGWLEDHDRAAA